LAHYPIYIVTDGNKHVQLAKLQALGLYDRLPVKRCFITRRYGVHREKPSPHCFQLICKMEQVSPDQVVYIGDNPNKDFVGIKPLGFRTVRLLRGNYAQLRKPKEYEADVVLRSLDELDETVVFRSNEG
jgi:putative hydrolase of the HAD superfamily